MQLRTLGVVLVVLLVVGVLLAKSGYLREAKQRLAERGQPAHVVDLHSVNQLRAAFNEDIGMPRLVLLLSPT